MRPSYPSGEPIRVGDRVSVDGDLSGRVVAVIGHEYAEAYPREEWEYLRYGVMVETEEVGPVFYGEEDHFAGFERLT